MSVRCRSDNSWRFRPTLRARAIADHSSMSRKQISRTLLPIPWAHTAAWLLLAALSGPIAAAADKVSVAAAAATAPAYVDLATSHSGFDCLPGPVGAGTLPTTRHNAAGSVAWWYCPVGASWRTNWAVATAAQMSVGNLFSEVRAVLGAADPRAAFNAAVSKNVNLPLNDPGLAAVWQPFAAEMAAGLPQATSTGSR